MTNRRSFTGSANRSHNGSLIVQEKVVYRPLTKRQYLRDVELKENPRKRVTLPKLKGLDGSEKRLARAEAERFLAWRLSRKK